MWYKKILLCVSIVAVSSSVDVYAAARGKQGHEAKRVQIAQKFDPDVELLKRFRALQDQKNVEEQRRRQKARHKQQCEMWKAYIKSVSQGVRGGAPDRRRSSCPSLLKPMQSRIRCRRASSSYTNRLSSRELIVCDEGDNKHDVGDSAVTLKNVERASTIFDECRGYTIEISGNRRSFFPFGKSDGTTHWLSMRCVGKDVNTDMVEVMTLKSQSKLTFRINENILDYHGYPAVFLDEAKLVPTGLPFVLSAKNACKMLRSFLV